MASKTWKGAQHRSLLEKCTSKLQWRITSHRSEWPSSKNLQTINAGEGVEKREPSCTIGGNVNWWSHYRDFLKSRNKTTIWPNNPQTGHIAWENHSWKRHMYPNVHSSTIYNSQGTEATQMYINRWMNKEAVVHIYNGIWTFCIWVGSSEVDEPRAYYTEWSKSERENQIWHIKAYIYEI